MCSPSFAAAEVDHRECINVHSADVFFSVKDGFCTLVFRELSVGTGGWEKGKTFGTTEHLLFDISLEERAIVGQAPWR